MLEVSDNGIGLPPPGRIHQGVGLRLMEHRCSLIGGRFVAESQPAGGTRIACILPAQPDLPGP
ncbi:ATP-binding region, ATPase-like domain protein [mine drainage metagenome]|uniref:ATP-binding region, ATPase-like domain protein n=1 Tax=mine drainage metagenome TaxID=410659 RepID=T1A8Y6_9ZZZZ